MQPFTALPSYPPTSYSTMQPTCHDQSSYPQQNTYAQVVIVAEVALMVCREEEKGSWTMAVLEECSEVVLVKTEVASMVAMA
ncbi:RNA-binding protein EWS [Heterocephalus glaber]|uniref:RNA-binding protein EWS n=1 Tax=Heterocephalus glaber TaxID=10181 RepID=G5B9N0_HETGA|nr:RNA-binding protein EWS [Heterocephalus glaber]